MSAKNLMLLAARSNDGDVKEIRRHLKSLESVEIAFISFISIVVNYTWTLYLHYNLLRNIINLNLP